MSSILDILGATIIGGLLLLIALTAMSSAVEVFFNYNADAIVQSQLAELSSIIQFDLRKMGYGIPEAAQNTIIQTATPNQVKFIAHLNLNFDYYISVHGNLHTDATPDTIEYQVVATDTINFVDTSVVMYSLMRTIKVSQENIETGVIGRITNDSVFVYLDQLGAPVTLITSTQMIQVTLVALNPEIVVSDVFLEATGAERINELRKLLRESYWRQTRVISRNLKR